VETINDTKPNPKVFTLKDYAYDKVALISKLEYGYFYMYDEDIYLYKLNEGDCEHKDGIRYYIFIRK